MSATFAGIHLENEQPRLVWALAKLLRESSEDEFEEPTLVDLQKMFSINPKFQNVLCAAQKIFDQDVAPQMSF
jgi:hypothetical protein